MEPIYPENRAKYNGRININLNMGSKFYVSVFNGNEVAHKFVNSREEARVFIREKSIEAGLTVRNMIHRISPDVYQCDVGNGKKLLFDPEDLRVVEDNSLWCDNGIAVTRNEGGKRVSFAEMVMPPRTEDEVRRGCRIHHYNRNRMDCRKSNMAWMTPKRGRVDAPGFRNNQTTGLMGITKRRELKNNGEYYNRFIVQWGGGHSKSFSFKDPVSEAHALRRAKEYRKNVLIGTQ